MTSRRVQLLKNAARITAIVVGSVVAAGGILHMPFARGLLMKAGGCPMAMEASPKEVDRQHQAALARDRGTESAPARPALGFDLDKMTRADVIRWAAQQSLSCQKDRGRVLRCNDVAPGAVGATPAEGRLSILSFAFNADDKLVDVSSMRTHLGTTAGVAAAQGIADDLAARLGGPHKQVGAFDRAHLSRKNVAGLSSITYRFRDYTADVTTMSFDTDGLVVREHYASIADGS